MLRPREGSEMHSCTCTGVLPVRTATADRTEAYLGWRTQEMPLSESVRSCVEEWPKQRVISA